MMMMITMLMLMMIMTTIITYKMISNDDDDDDLYLGGYDHSYGSPGATHPTEAGVRQSFHAALSR